MKGQLDIFGNEQTGEEEYHAFTEKFKPKKTTDDCYTPELIYDAIADWVAKEYRLDRADFVRPFWPGGDYRRFEYPQGCVVVDNPPFSLLAQIQRYYIGKGVKFFLFGPSLTLFAGNHDGVCFVLAGVQITYENGADVNTSFVTNLESRYRIRIPVDLYEAVDKANNANLKAQRKSLPKYIYPDYVITGAAYRLAKYGIELNIPKEECYFIRALDSQIPKGKTIFGGGYLLSERAAAERAAAERAAAERAAATKWELSERELAIIRRLGEASIDAPE